jgi:hypothetical protein
MMRMLGSQFLLESESGYFVVTRFFMRTGIVSLENALAGGIDASIQ